MGIGRDLIKSDQIFGLGYSVKSGNNFFLKIFLFLFISEEREG